MGTIVTIDVPVTPARPDDDTLEAAHVDRAFAWFREVEQACSRFDPASELLALCQRPGERRHVSPLLFEAVRFALAVAADTDGAFDPTVGYRLERMGFDRAYRSGQTVTTLTADTTATWRDVDLDPTDGTITLRKPLVLDLGSVAKGLAIDLAARELRPLVDFGIDAGGDLFLGGHRPDGRDWSVGIRHPYRDDVLLGTVRATSEAVCTSGQYERQRDHHGRPHIVDPRGAGTCDSLVSVTVIAPTAMLADALATAVFVLGPIAGRQLLDRMGLCGVLCTSTLDCIVTQGCGSDRISIP